MSIIRTKPAQSLLEAIIAIGVILVATISSTTLVVSTISAGRVSADKIQAANFAREGFEVVREIRDSNWMKRAQNVVDGGVTTVQWDDSGSFSDTYKPLGRDPAPVAPTLGYCYLPKFDPTTGWKLTPSPLNLDQPCLTNAGSIDEALISEESVLGNSYTFLTGGCAASITVTCIPTKFSRIVGIIKVTDANAGDYLSINSKVVWNDHGHQRVVNFLERLYDWR